MALDRDREVTVSISTEDTLLALLREQANALQALQQLVSAALPPGFRDRHVVTNKDALENLATWETEILKYRVGKDLNDVPRLLQTVLWHQGGAFEDVKLPDRVYHSWPYRTAYPRLSRFLDESSFLEASRAGVICEETNQEGERSVERAGAVQGRWKARIETITLDHRSVWKMIKVRVGGLGHRRWGDVDIHADHNLQSVGFTRTLKITDLSPLLACMALAATPRLAQPGPALLI